MGQTASTPSTSTTASCPINHTNPPAQCPVAHTSPAKCPVDDKNIGEINPLNQMPSLSQSPAPNQSIELPVSRETSSIPREGPSKWVYPSPQQFYNALVRKGWETPEEHIPTMVDIHNFLNEEAWQEILKWEGHEDSTPELARFKGRPGQLSPKARFLLFAGWLLPSRFNSDPPFDRHDWVVRRPQTGKEVRYIIDYYTAPPLPDGSPVFSLDVRPALDSFAGIQSRIRGWGVVWNDAVTRENSS